MAPSSRWPEMLSPLVQPIRENDNMAPDYLNILKPACGIVENGLGVQGTGYLVSPNQMVTCHHVIGERKKGEQVTVTFDDNQPRFVTVDDIDEENDIAVLRFAEAPEGRTPLPLAAPCDNGAPWQSYGFPLLGRGSGLPLFGQILDPLGKDSLKRTARQLYSPPVGAGLGAKVYGFSGSPIVVSGAVVGHLKRILSDDEEEGRSALGLLFATPSEAILARLGMTSAACAAVEVPSGLLTPAPISADEYHAFISYSHANGAWARRLHSEMVAAGFRVFVDEQELRAGDNWAVRLADGMRKSRAAVVLLSHEWLNSKLAGREADELLRRNSEADFRVIPILLESLELPPAWSSIQYIDCRGVNHPRGAKLEEILFAVAGQAPPRSVAVAAIAENAARRAATGLPATAVDREMAESLIAIGQPEAALKLLPADSSDVRVRQLRALALGKAGDPEAALAILAALKKEGHPDSGETGGLIAGRYRQKWERTKDPRWLTTARVTYVEAWEASKCESPFPGINAASMLLCNGQKEKAREIAARILDLLGRKDLSKLSHWDLATVAEAHLILENFPAAHEWYEKAVAADPTRIQDIATIRKSARWDLEALGRARNELDDVLAVPNGVVFIGHSIDDPASVVPRFPAHMENDVRSDVRKALEKLCAGFGVCSASPGSDILFLEEMVLHRNEPVRIVLPCLMSRFAREFLTREWRARLDKILRGERVELVEIEAGDPQDVWADFDKRLREEADRLARQLDQEPYLLAVWDGKPGSFVARTLKEWQGPMQKILLA